MKVAFATLAFNGKSIGYKCCDINDVAGQARPHLENCALLCHPAIGKMSLIWKVCRRDSPRCYPSLQASVIGRGSIGWDFSRGAEEAKE